MVGFKDKKYKDPTTNAAGKKGRKIALAKNGLTNIPGADSRGIMTLDFDKDIFEPKLLSFETSMFDEIKSN